VKSQSNVSYDATAGNSGSYNSSFGYYAGDVVTGSRNTFTGYFAGKLTSSGNHNVFNGAYSGYLNSTGENNLYVGYRVCFGANGASENTSVGHKSGTYISSGSNNTFLGSNAGYSTSTGARNVYVGFFTGFNATGSDNIFLGHAAGYFETGSDKLYIENSSSRTPLIYGGFDSTYVKINGKLGIGTKEFNNAQMVVDGKIRASKVLITTDDFPDYVFEHDYQLMPVGELEAYIKTNKHLPGIKPATEVLSEGLSLNEVNVQLLEKVEELTLYIINMDKKRAEIKEQNSDIQKTIEKMLNKI
jgi:hypothetical protein